MPLQFRHLVLALACVTAGAAAVTPGERPNILFIVADDLGYADVGFHGCKDVPTPHIDRLAQSGVRFTNGYVSGAYCSPTRAGLMTGRYQQSFGHEFHVGRGEQGLPVTDTTIADRLKAAGYVTGLVGKWHLGYLPQFHPQRRGFDEFFGFLGGGHDYFDSASLLRGTEKIVEREYLTDAFGREAEAFIARHAQRPWFLCLSFNAVHTPMQVPEDRLARFASIPDGMRRTYAGMLTAMDDAIGRVMSALEAQRSGRRTLVAFISDNGGPTMPASTLNGASNAPLRGSKRTLLEAGIRVPFVISWPGHLAPGVFEPPVIQLDLIATALAAAGITAQPEWRLDGVDLLPYLRGAKSGPPHEALYWRFGPQMAIRIGDYKLVRYDRNVDTRTGEIDQPVTPAKLYHLGNDLGETRDLMKTEPGKARELQAKWDAWNATLIKPLWGRGTVAEEGADPAAARKRGRREEK